MLLWVALKMWNYANETKKNEYRYILGSQTTGFSIDL